MLIAQSLNPTAFPPFSPLAAAIGIIAEDLQAALDQFTQIAADLRK
jgi:hypothetical protein